MLARFWIHCYNSPMTVIEKDMETAFPVLPKELEGARRLVFYDIETTGLSAYSSSLYLIGALTYEEGRARFYQWFAPSLSCELEILRAFFRFLRPGDLLVSFNGETFDRNYLTACANQYTEGCPLSGIPSVDLLRKIRKHKDVFGLPGLRQKAVERFLGIEREDMYTGGELIAVY
ncbi:MAG: ribonuclease H-like domain-containing protein, partial [Lachnospiraceae bacterium]|nr:ribonuclease H-like domain-containing protein [Lachnospiraceae bacterium]